MFCNVCKFDIKIIVFRSDLDENILEVLLPKPLNNARGHVRGACPPAVTSAAEAEAEEAQDADAAADVADLGKPGLQSRVLAE